MPDGYRTQTEELLEGEFELCPRCGAKKMTPVSSADESLRVCLECGVVPQPGEGDVAAEQPEKEGRPAAAGAIGRRCAENALPGSDSVAIIAPTSTEVQ